MEEFAPYNFTVLSYPCNQFSMQEPGANSEILNGIKHVRPGGGYEPNFTMFEKGDVNGATAQDVWKFLTDTCKSPNPSVGVKNNLYWNNIHVDDVRWTFSDRFIVDADGVPYIRIYDPSDPYEPGGLRDDLEQYFRDGYIDL
ncbi:glutathione peroxidase 6-like [Ptychodera flava]|uniref:glutathione peroxidase 6-like n=1 Tax=Ptychodera flava TaxID=63121 RepID=UPI00396A1E08